MFDKQYIFKGIHAKKVIELTNKFEATAKPQLFKTNVDVYANAPLIGFLYVRKAELDNTKNPETNEVYDTKVFKETVIDYAEKLLFNFQLIMLLDSSYESDVQKRINKAFRHIGEDPNDEELFNSYVRGGVDVLYEKLIEGAKEPADYINKLYEFVEEFQERFNDGISSGLILNLC